MKVQTKKRTNLVIGAMLVVAALATAFWVLLLSPKRDEADKLAGEVATLESSLSQHQAEAESAELARSHFASDYQHLVVLGKAVPADSETASLLVQVNKLAHESEVSFETLTLDSAGGEEAPAASAEGSVSATEAAASLMPLGASIGPAGLAVMPYTLTFEGSFFKIADFIEKLDNLVKSSNEDVAVDGRLITVNGFSLSPSSEGDAPTSDLQATFSVTTFLTPPGQTALGGATPAGLETQAGTLASMSTGATP